MPFKGDRRLGGPHDNERTLNGTSSDFDSVPAYGTEVSRVYSETYGSSITINGYTYWGATGYHVVLNDGLGGTYETDEITNRPNTGSVVTTLTYNSPYPETDLYNFGGPVGERYRKYITALYYYYDGAGGFYTNSNFAEYYKTNGELITSQNVDNTSNTPIGYIPNGTYMTTEYRWDGNGGYTTSYGGGGSWYSYGTVIAFISQSDNYTTVGGLGNIANGTYTTSNYIWDGNSGYTTSTTSGGSYYSYGTFITYDGSYNYYWDGYGGYYTQYIYGP